MSSTVSHLYEFGLFRLDPTQRLLLRKGSPVSLTPKAFDLLVAMVEQNGHLLVKDKLMGTVWPGVSVEEGNLAVTVSQLRKALGDDRGEHRYIETVSKKGYRFVAPVVDRPEPTAEVVPSPLESVSPPVLPALDEALHLPKAPTRPVPLVSLLHWGVIALAGVLLAAFLMVGRTLANRRALVAVDATSIRSLAVMPFKTIGARSSDEYLGLGTADALITRLSNTGKVLVRPTSAIERYRNSSISPQSAGREQEVDAILNGRIQHDGNRVRMTVQMVRVRDGAQLWAQTFDEEFTNAFNLEDEVSERVAHSIRLQLTDKEHDRFLKRPTDKPEAYNAFVKGRYYWNKRTREGLKKGLEYFREAIRIDPGFSEAYEGVADSYAGLGLYAALPPEEAFPAAREAAHKALEMNEDLADAHATLGLIDFYYDWNGAASLNEFQRAFDSNRNYVMAHSWNAESLAAMGRFPEAVAEARLAVEEDPLSLIVNSNAGWTFCLAGHYEEAIQTLQKAIDVDPSFPRTHFRLGEVYEIRGLYDQAIEEFTRAVKLSGGDIYYTADLGHAYAVSGRTSEAREILRTLRAKASHQYVPAFAIAMVYLGLGDNDSALRWLEKAANDHSTSMAYLKVDPFLRVLDSDPRFQKLIQRVNF
jgi:DNA-binding winged helix-turn-helix (wHTH) protein/TolB-like protein